MEVPRVKWGGCSGDTELYGGSVGEIYADAVVTFNGQVYVFGIGVGDNQIYVQQGNPSTNTWSGWQLLWDSARTYTSVAPVVYNNTLYVFYVGYYDHLPHYQYSTDALYWNYGGTIGTNTTQSMLAATVYNNILYLFAKIGLGEHYHYYAKYSSQFGWDYWHEVGPGGAWTPYPDTATVYQGALWLFSLGTGNDHFWNRLDGTTWSGWTPLEIGGSSTSPTFATTFQGRLYLFSIGPSDHGHYVASYGGAAWTNWSLLPGLVSSTVSDAATVFNDKLYLFSVSMLPEGRHYFAGGLFYEQDIALHSAMSGGLCEYGGHVDYPCEGVHGAALEVVGYDDGSSYGDIYAAVFWNGWFNSYGAFDTRRGKLQSGSLPGDTKPSVNPGGHTGSCSVNGYYPTSYGCAWFVSQREYQGISRVDLIQARTVRPSTPPAGVTWTTWQNWASGHEPAGDAGGVYDFFTHRTVWRLLVVYASPDRTQLLGQRVNKDGTKLGSQFQIYAGERVRAPQVAWRSELFGGRWLVAYEAKKDVPGGYTGNIYTTVVNWDGTVGATNDIAWCEEGCVITAGGNGVLTAGGDGVLINDGCICKGMWLAAAPYFQPNQYLLHEYFYDHLLGSSGERLSTVSDVDLYDAVALTAVAGEQFQQVTDSLCPYWPAPGPCYPGVHYFPADTSPPEDPWDGGREQTQDYQVSGIPSSNPQGVRRGQVSSGLLHTLGQGAPVYLSVITDP